MLQERVGAGPELSAGRGAGRPRPTLPLGPDSPELCESGCWVGYLPAHLLFSSVKRESCADLIRFL